MSHISGCAVRHVVLVIAAFFPPLAQAVTIGPPEPPRLVEEGVTPVRNTIFSSVQIRAVPVLSVLPTTENRSNGETIERVSGEARGPRIPEPMIFDLVRPLGGKRGEGEVNVLGLIPLRRKARTVDDATDPLGLVRRSQDTQGIEWAPEIEYDVWDGVGLEFELPMENGRVEAYKGAGQVFFGTALEHHFIHGAQVIVQYDQQPKLWTTTFLYLAGFRFNETWSVFGMFGPRTELGGRVSDRRTEWLSNATLFADVTRRLVAGIETNLGQVIDGHASLLVMPQLHYEVSRRWMIQGGVGVRWTKDLTLPEIGFRLIREF
ncbi:MAG: hypothetical protein A4E19_10860 [Nitrospira sp. SG-bin1]|nr:MAG: hypothetical protein A4E19_10860 [Nitrospira sp. SG-bin1]